MAISRLVLGWEVSATFDPNYWLSHSAKAGHQSDHDLVAIKSSLIAAHTAIIAQSGSGKSFFLGRLIEEIAIKTKSRCVIIDPNADFRNINKIVGESLWSNAKYDHISRKGKLPHEKDKESFEKLWRDVSIQINGAFENAAFPRKNIKLLWPSVAIELITDDIDPMLKNEIYHCHRLVDAFAKLVSKKNRSKTKGQKINYIDEAQEFLRLTRTSNFNLKGTLEKKFVDVDNTLISNLFSFFRRNKEDLFQQIINASEYISVAAERYYFGKVKEFDAAGILDDSTGKDSEEKEEPYRLNILDLPSLKNKSIQFLAISSFLKLEQARVQEEWNKVIENDSKEDTRVPTFIIVDEAHNLMPAVVTSKAQEVLRETFRTIIAEGRKYGLFLILVSQRPDKLDPLIVSECENRAIMKLSSLSVLETTKKMLGLEDISPGTLAECLKFPSGRVLLMGQWTENTPKFLYCASRRTVEGGRDLSKEYWASEPDITKNDEGENINSQTASKKNTTTTPKNKNDNGKGTGSVG